MRQLPHSVLEIHPTPFTVTSTDRLAVIEHLPTFMNQCEGGQCGCTGDDVKPPDEFEVAVLTAMKSIDDIALAPYHSSQKKAVFEFLLGKVLKRSKYHQTRYRACLGG